MFDDYLDSDYLKKLYYKTKLYKGEHFDNISEIIPSNELKVMNEEKSKKGF